MQPDPSTNGYISSGDVEVQAAVMGEEDVGNDKFSPEMSSLTCDLVSQHLSPTILAHIAHLVLGRERFNAHCSTKVFLLPQDLPIKTSKMLQEINVRFILVSIPVQYF